MKAALIVIAEDLDLGQRLGEAFAGGAELHANPFAPEIPRTVDRGVGEGHRDCLPGLIVWVGEEDPFFALRRDRESGSDGVVFAGG